jgi:RNase P/RNase MRP subunit p29
MNNKYTSKLKKLYVVIVIFCAQNAFAAANFNIVPYGALPTSVISGQTVSAYYTVTNMNHGLNSGKGYVVRGLPATVTQNTTSPNCTNPINLGPYPASCQLQLDISGAVSSNFAICKGNSCTTAATPLNVAASTAPSAYTVSGTVSGLTATGLVLQNNGADNLTVPNGVSSFTFSTPVASGGSYNVTALSQPPGFTCRISNGTGSITSANVTNISVTCTTSYAYITQYSGADAVVVCGVSNTGDLTTPCFPANSGINTTNNPPLGIEISEDGSTAYITTASADVFQCTIDPLSAHGEFISACTLIAPIANTISYNNVYGFLAVNSDNTLAYLGDYNRVIACNIISDTLQANCQDTGATLQSTDPLSGVALSPDNSVLYIGEYNYPYVSTCSTNTIPFAPCGQKTGGGAITFTAPTGVVVNRANTFVYITDSSNNQIYACDTISSISATTFNSCILAYPTTFPISPWGITLSADNSKVYVTGNFVSTIYTCSVSQTFGTFSNCTSITGFSDPLDVAIS